MTDHLQQAVADTLEEQLLPELERLAGDRADELRDVLRAELLVLAERATNAALRGDAGALAMLEATPKLILDRERVRLEAAALEAQRAIVRAVFSLLFKLAANR